MGYLTYKAEKGAFGLAWLAIKFAFAAALVLWPLAIGATDNYKHLSVVGIVLEVMWVVVLLAVAFAVGASRRARRRS